MEGSGSSMIGTRDRRLRMALLSARRKTGQTFEIPSRVLERRIYQKIDFREK